MFSVRIILHSIEIIRDVRIFFCTTPKISPNQKNREAEELDLAEQTAQDYSVIITDPNPDCLDPDE